MSLGTNITKYREQCGLSQEQLAEKLSIPLDTIVLWETGQDQPTQDSLIKLAEIFGISVEELRKGADVKQADKPLFTASTKYTEEIYKKLNEVYQKIYEKPLDVMLIDYALWFHWS